MDKPDTARPDEPAREDATAAADAAVEAKRADKSEELDEGLDESFPGSDAPSSTRRSSAGDGHRADEAKEKGTSEQPS